MHSAALLVPFDQVVVHTLQIPLHPVSSTVYVRSGTKDDDGAPRIGTFRMQCDRQEINFIIRVVHYLSIIGRSDYELTLKHSRASSNQGVLFSQPLVAEWG